jgi:hypothetical protein
MARSTSSGGNRLAEAEPEPTAEPEPDFPFEGQPGKRSKPHMTTIVILPLAEIRSLHPMSVVYGPSRGVASFRSIAGGDTGL